MGKYFVFPLAEKTKTPEKGIVITLPQKSGRGY